MNEAKDSDTRAEKWALSAVILAAVSYLVLLGEEDVIFFFAGREMLFEMVGALCFLLASGACLAAFLRSRRAARTPFPNCKHLYLALACFFFVAFGEEISWGQMIFGFKAPESIAGLNEQRELNIHNLEIFDAYSGSVRKSGWRALVTSNRLFDYFMITVFLLAPLGQRTILPLRRFLHPRGIRAVAGVFAVALLFNMALTILSELLTEGGFMRGAISEIREFNYAYLCFVAFLTLYLSEPHVEEAQ